MPLQIDPKNISGSMATDAELTAGLALKAPLASPTFTGTTTTDDLVVTGTFTGPVTSLDKTITPGGTTGNQTINKSLGTVNFAAGTDSLVVTNSLVDANSIIHCMVRTDQINTNIWSVVATPGSFTIKLFGPSDIEVSVGFIVYN